MQHELLKGLIGLAIASVDTGTEFLKSQLRAQLEKLEVEEEWIEEAETQAGGLMEKLKSMLPSEGA
ncbi:hypothetical protein [Paenibacillus sp. PL2-23]|uniref:hypothetical protein n=1 Tax=Paenibacillus sp. PL2-23 TaxID=2100729 RepID=UPI0030FAFB23